MEVLLATAILLGCVLVLMELASIGRYYVQSVDARSMAQLLCQTKLNELLAGVQPLEEVEERAIEDYPDWLYSVTLEPVAAQPLVAVRVTVTEQVLEGTTRGARGKPKQFSLVRWVPAPERGALWSGPADSTATETGAMAKPLAD
jgi:hypothetical protein